MYDLIWIGNTLFPRGVFFGAALLFITAAVGVFVILMDDE